MDALAADRLPGEAAPEMYVLCVGYAKGKRGRAFYELASQNCDGHNLVPGTLIVITPIWHTKPYKPWQTHIEVRVRGKVRIDCRVQPWGSPLASH